MALFCSHCNFPICSSQSQKRFSIERPFATKSSILARPSILKVSIFTSTIFINFNPSLQKHHCASSSSGLPVESSSKIHPTAIVFVKGLAKSTSEGSLKTAFSQFGDISRVKIVTNKKTRDSLGFSYIWFSREEVAQRAAEEMNGKFFEGRFIHVTVARPGSCKTHVKATPYKF